MFAFWQLFLKQFGQSQWKTLGKKIKHEVKTFLVIRIVIQIRLGAYEYNFNYIWFYSLAHFCISGELIEIKRLNCQIKSCGLRNDHHDDTLYNRKTHSTIILIQI